MQTRIRLKFLYSSAPTDMRYSLDLCDEENDFLQKRKHVVFEAMKKLLGQEGPKTVDEVGQKKVADKHVQRIKLPFECSTRHPFTLMVSQLKCSNTAAEGKAKL